MRPFSVLKKFLVQSRAASKYWGIEGFGQVFKRFWRILSDFQKIEEIFEDLLDFQKFGEIFEKMRLHQSQSQEIERLEDLVKFSKKWEDCGVPPRLIWSQSFLILRSSFELSLFFWSEKTNLSSFKLSLFFWSEDVFYFFQFLSFSSVFRYEGIPSPERCCIKILGIEGFGQVSKRFCRILSDFHKIEGIFEKMTLHQSRSQGIERFG